MRRMGEALGAGTDFAREQLHTAKVALGGRSDPERHDLLGREDVEEEADEAADEAMAAHLRAQAAKAAVSAGASLALSALLPVNPVSPVMAALSARSTEHIIGLLETLQRTATDEEDKAIIKYAIHQKSKKKLRKTASIAPAVGSAVSALGLVRWAYKKKKGTLGEERRDYARRLAGRLCATGGPEGLSHEIVYALYGNSPAELKTVQALMGNPDAALHLFYKLRST